MISALHLVWIVPVTMLAGFILCSLLTIKYRDQADNWRRWARAQMEATDHYRRKLDEAEQDMCNLLDCCDICGNNNNPNCPGDDCLECGAGCPCKECRNSSNFVWRGLL